MSMEFTGKEVADAIRAACEHFHVSREELSIEVLETGSSGIFGLIRKKAKIRAELRPDNDALGTVTALPCSSKQRRSEQRRSESRPTEQRQVEQQHAEPELHLDSDETEVDAVPFEEEQTVSPESLAVVHGILDNMLRLMEMPSALEITADNLLVTCAITGEFEEELVGQDGRIIDSLQYFLHKIAVKQCPEPLRIAVNVGNFRERRLEQLRATAKQLADEVRQSGKTRIIPALNPAERREIHMLLQNDPEVRSRSVGDGIFKRVLLFKLGRPSGKRSAKHPPNGQPKAKRTASRMQKKPENDD